jgi:DNA topoisomerase-3
MVKAGWQGVFAFEHLKMNEEEAYEDYLPELSEGEELEIQSLEVLEKQTKPKPLHTEASLLTAMQNAGKEVENETERAALKDCGIGTPATRAAIIETLFVREYIQRQKKSLIPTEKGLSVFNIVKDKQISDVSMTGSWENALSQIERGEIQPETFRIAIDAYTRQITAELLDTPISPTLGGGQGEAFLCPKCKVAYVLIVPKVTKCSDTNCGLTVFRTISEKQLSDKQIADLLTKSKTEVIKGFKSKAGKSFSATLKFDENFRVVYDFPPKRGKK